MNVLKLIFVTAWVLGRARSHEYAGDGRNLIASCEPARAGVSRISGSDQLRGFVMYDEELGRFKFYNLAAFVASSYLFVIDKRESSRNSIVMRRGHEKIIISRKPDGHYTYWSPHDDTDHGTIIDFVQRRKGLTLGGVRKELREWTGAPSPPFLQLPELAHGGKDLDAVRKRYDAMRIAERHPYLENERGVAATVLMHWRFAGVIRIDRFGAAVFPHRDPDGNLSGYEAKNTGGFTGFATGGRKQIWLSNARPDDQRLVICESAIDALSHAALFDDPRARYASTAGKTTAAQDAAIRAAILAMPADSEIVAATDADDSGRKLAGLIAKIVEDSGRDDLSFRRDEPTEKDFNDVLRKKRNNSRPQQRPGAPAVA
jgi:hypothetical protein